MADETAAAKTAEGAQAADGGVLKTDLSQGTKEGEGTFERSLLTKDIETAPPAAAGEGAPQGSSKCSPDGEQNAPSEPEVPEKYELTMPEGWSLDEEGLAELTPIMQGLGATNEQVQAVADLYVKRLSAAREAQLAADQAMLAEWQNEIKTDPEIGGAELKENLATVSRVLAKYAGPEFVAYLDRSNLGNYPPFVKAMVKMAKDLSDDRFIPGGRGGSGGDPVKEAAELIYGKLS